MPGDTSKNNDANTNCASPTNVKPPPLDEFFCANEAHLRAAELAELGYSEAMIWGTA